MVVGVSVVSARSPPKVFHCFKGAHVSQRIVPLVARRRRVVARLRRVARAVKVEHPLVSQRMCNGFQRSAHAWRVGILEVGDSISGLIASSDPQSPIPIQIQIANSFPIPIPIPDSLSLSIPRQTAEARRKSSRFFPRNSDPSNKTARAQENNTTTQTNKYEWHQPSASAAQLTALRCAAVHKSQLLRTPTQRQLNQV